MGYGALIPLFGRQGPLALRWARCVVLKVPMGFEIKAHKWDLQYNTAMPCPPKYCYTATLGF
jgi:hypothetical protein